MDGGEVETEVEPEPGPPCSEDEPDERIIAYVEDSTFHTGPYLMHTTTRSTVVMWETLLDGPGLLEIASADELGDLGDEAAFAAVAERHEDVGERYEYVKEGLEEAAPTTIHEILVKDLVPNTRYAYRVSVGEQISKIHDFYTAPADGCPIRYTVWGDSRSQIDKCSAVVQSMMPFNPYLNLNVGDVVTTGSEIHQWKEEYFDPLRPLGHQVPSYIAIGNHEQNVRYFYDRVHFPMHSEKAQDESYYSFTYGNTFFVVIDTNKPFFPIGPAKPPQVEWFEEAIASEEAQAATWRVAFAHHPGYSEAWDPGGCGSYDGTPTVRTYVLPILAAHNFQVYFAGHTHDYERGFEDSLLQIISGGGGASLDDWCLDFEHVTVMASAYHHMQVTATSEELRIDAVDLDGDLIDHVLLRSDMPGVIADEDPPESP